MQIVDLEVALLELALEPFDLSLEIGARLEHGRQYFQARSIRLP